MRYRYSYRQSRLGKPGKMATIIIISLAIAIASSLAYTGYYLYAAENSPVAKFVSGTIYVAAERGQVIVRVNDRFGNPVSDAQCKATIIHPDKTFFVVDMPMNQSSVFGNYFYEFITPQQLGLYEEIVRCTATRVGSPINLTVSSSFQVSRALTYVQNLSEQQIALLNNISSRLESQLNSINETMNQRIDGIETKINSTETNLTSKVEAKFNRLYINLYNATDAMSRVFITALNGT